MELESQAIEVLERIGIMRGQAVLDFNQAYNPWCVYSEAYTCPFVSVESWLEVPILAGEKNYPLKSYYNGGRA
jgi:uncharacterized protein (DUF1684 family)